MLADRPDVTTITSLAGRTRSPKRPAGAVRIGGFGGAEGLARWLEANAIDAAMDATHPFAATISANAAAACRRLGAPRAALTRPAWTRVPGDRWVAAANAEAAAARVGTLGRRPLLAIGRRGLASFAACRDARFVVRVFEPLDESALPGADVRVSRGPFDEAAEIAFLRREAIDLVVTKNAGGRAAYGKVAAARALGLPVLIIDRPPPPEPPRVATVEAAAAWVARVVAARR